MAKVDLPEGWLRPWMASNILLRQPWGDEESDPVLRNVTPNFPSTAWNLKLLEDQGGPAAGVRVQGLIRCKVVKADIRQAVGDGVNQCSAALVIIVLMGQHVCHDVVRSLGRAKSLCRIRR